MNKKVIQINPHPLPYSPGLEISSSSRTIFLSGQIGLNQEGQLVASFEGQCRQIFQNIEDLLQAAGYSVADIVKTTIFLTDLQDFSVFNKLYKNFLKEPYPTRSTVQVTALPKGALVEIELLACK